MRNPHGQCVPGEEDGGGNAVVDDPQAAEPHQPPRREITLHEVVKSGPQCYPEMWIRILIMAFRATPRHFSHQLYTSEFCQDVILFQATFERHVGVQVLGLG